MDGVKLKLLHYDEDDRITESINFEVKQDWLLEYLGKDENELEDYLEEYCSDDSEDIYIFAKMADALISEIIKTA